MCTAAPQMGVKALTAEVTSCFSLDKMSKWDLGTSLSFVMLSVVKQKPFHRKEKGVWCLSFLSFCLFFLLYKG